MRKIPDLSIVPPGHTSMKMRAPRWILPILYIALAGCAHSSHKAMGPSIASPMVRTDVQKLLTQAKIPKEATAPAPVLYHHSFEIVLPVRRLKINQRFYDSRWRIHLGVDLGGHWGDPIYAATPGTVVYAGSGFHGFGKMIIIAYSHKWATLYAHLSRFRVRTGRHVRAGQRIGDMGRTGHATGVHLHFELLLNKLPINPLPYLEQAANRPRPRAPHRRGHSRRHRDLAAHD